MTLAEGRLFPGKVAMSSKPCTESAAGSRERAVYVLLE